MRVALDGLLLGGLHSGVERSIEALLTALPTAAPQHEYLLACLPRYRDRGPGGMPRLCAPGWVRSRAARILYEEFVLPGVLRGRCDVLHAPGYILPARWRGPSVLTVYDLIALRYPEYCKPANVWHYKRALLPGMARATRVVVPSAAVAADVRALFTEAVDRLRVVSLGVEAAYQPARPETVAVVRERYGLPEQFLLFVGNLEPKKNVTGMVAAFEQIAREAPHHFVLAGRPGWKHEPTLRALARSPYRDRIHRLGYVAEADLPALYTAADVLLQWSWTEGFGLPPLEAMACGTVAVVSDGGALPEVAGTAAVVVPLGVPGDLAVAVSDLLQDAPRLAELRRRGREHAAQFTWERHARAVAALYEEAADA